MQGPCLLQSAPPSLTASFVHALEEWSCDARPQLSLALLPLQAGTFCRSADLLTAAAVTSRSGIRMLLPGADIDDYAFEPCGYSMNALQGSTLATIHVTPEEGFSYASFEISGPSLADLHALETVSKVRSTSHLVSMVDGKSAGSALQGPPLCRSASLTSARLYELFREYHCAL